MGGYRSYAEASRLGLSFTEWEAAMEQLIQAAARIPWNKGSIVEDQPRESGDTDRRRDYGGAGFGYCALLEEVGARDQFPASIGRS